MTPNQERLHELFEQHKDDIDGGFFGALTTFSNECFNELKTKNLTPGLLHSFLVAAYHEGYNRHAIFMKNLEAEIEKLNND